MKKKNDAFEEQIAALAAAFAVEVAAFARARTLDQLRGAFAKGVGDALDKSARDSFVTPWTKRVGRVVVHRKSAHAAAPVKGAKRDAKALEQLKTRLLRYLGKQPGSSVEEIARGLQCSTRALVLPINKALATGEITKKGARRGTRYSAA